LGGNTQPATFFTRFTQFTALKGAFVEGWANWSVCAWALPRAKRSSPAGPGNGKARQPGIRRITATLHYQSDDLEEHKTITVTTTFKTATSDE
jgi:hypothetical protein